MAVDLTSKKIIMIHGLASKPPPDFTHNLWRRTLTENIRVSHRQLARSLDAHADVFESAYWANVVPHHIPDDAGYCKKLQLQVDKVIDERREIKDGFHVGMKEKVGSFFKDRGLDLVKLLAGALSVKDDVMTEFLRETELYEQDQYIADQIRAPLENALRRAWDEGREPIVVAHSMGTFISYDVLWRFAHRKTADFKKYNNKRVKMFITLGSPLGEFPSSKKFRSIDYVDLHNPFEVVTHAGNRNREKRNPHKSYGYLAQPRLGSWIADYLLDRLR
jgi:hypothetical protein